MVTYKNIPQHNTTSICIKIHKTAIPVKISIVNSCFIFQAARAKCVKMRENPIFPAFFRAFRLDFPDFRQNPRRFSGFGKSERN
jgi:hypothetical protein